MNNYQPVSNLCFISKILEKHVLLIIIIIIIINDLFLSLNKGNIYVLALLDFSSAFDTIDHPILVHRLHTEPRFTDAVLQWFSSYLTDHTHYVSLSNHCSALVLVHSGVPRGSVHGPILFTMHIKPLSAIIDSWRLSHPKELPGDLPVLLDCHTLTMNTIVLQLSDAVADISMLQCSAQFRILFKNANFVVDNATHALASSATARPTFNVEEEDVVIRNGWTPKEEDDSHSIIHHSFADDIQLQMSAPHDRITELLHSMKSCISDVKAWTTVNMLKLNDNKTELMLVTLKRTKHLHNLATSITIGNDKIPFKQSVKNLGFTSLSSCHECTCLQYCTDMLL